MLHVAEARLILRGVLDEAFLTISTNRIGTWSNNIRPQRCTRMNDDGDEVLGCLIQAPIDELDPSSYSCRVIDPLEVPCITRRHEHLISDIIHVSTPQSAPSSTRLTLRVPVDHYYVQTWQEVIVRELEPSGVWADVYEAGDLVYLDDNGKCLYGVQLEVRQDTHIAVVARPKVTSFTLGARDLVVESPVDYDVKLHIAASYELERNPKRISLQVIPIDSRTVADFQEVQKNPLLSGSSPLVIVQVDGHTPESMTFTLPITLGQDGRQSRGTSFSNPRRQSRVSSLSNLRKPERRGQLTPTSPFRSKSPRFLFPPSQRGFRMQESLRDKRTHHLVQLNGGTDMRVKLVEAGEKIVYENTDCKEVRCSLYDKGMRLVALETTGMFQYTEIQQLAANFLDNIEKHKVLLRINQEGRDIYKVYMTAEISQKSLLPVSTHARAPTPSFSSRRLILEEGEAIGLVFRGNVEVLHQQQFMYFSFHGCRGIRRRFDIKVKDPFSQKSLESYHGAVQVWILKDRRTKALNTQSIPSERGGWKMLSVFPIVLPKYIKKAPLVVNRAPVAIPLKEPLSQDMVQKICREVQHNWYKFGVNLGVSHARIQSLKLQNKNVVSDRLVKDILVSWMKNQPITSDMITPMIGALFACRSGSLADELRHRRDTFKKARFKKHGVEKTPKACLALSKHPEVVARWKDVYEALESVERVHNTCIDDVIDTINKNVFDESHKLLSALEHWQSKSELPSVDRLEKALKKCRLYGAVNLCR